MTLDSDIVPDIFDTSKPHKCPFYKDPRTCTCPTCGWARDFVRSRASLARAEDRNFGRNREGGGTTFGALRAPEPPPQHQESPREKQDRQRRERYKESERVWAQVQANNAERIAKSKTPTYGNDPDFIKGYVEHSENKDLSGLLSLTPAASVVDGLNAAKDFITNPSIGSAAMIAVAAIPGKYADEAVDFVGKYKGKEVVLSDIKMVDVTYVKRSKEELGILRKVFNNGVRKNYLIELSTDPDVINNLKRLNVPNAEINKIYMGRVPASFEVHHKLPLDDSGTNDFSNLVLIRKSPEHAALTTYQKQTTNNFSIGESVEVKWPIPNESVYPKK